MRPLLLTALVAVLVAGCTPAADQDAAAGPPAAVSTAVTPAPSTAPTTTTPAALSKAQAARRYLRIVKPYNRALEALEKAINAGQPIPRLRRLAAAALTASKIELRDLRAARWPSVVRGPVNDLVRAIRVGLADWRRASEADTREAMIRAVSTAVGRGSDAAKTIRQRLQLEKYDEDDY